MKNLAVAYAIKRRNQKMAKGGEINEELHPEHDNPKAIETDEIGPEHLDMLAQEHEDLDEPKEPKRHVMPPVGLMKKMMMRRMASGGMVDSLDNAGDMEHPDNDFLSDEEQTPYSEDAPPKHRRGVIEGIIRSLRGR